MKFCKYIRVRREHTWRHHHLLATQCSIWKRIPPANMTPTSTKSIGYFLAQSPDWYRNLWHLNIPDDSTVIRKLIS